MSTLSSFTRLGGLLMLGPRGEIGSVSEEKVLQTDHELTRSFASYTVHYLKEYAANLDDHRFRIGLLYRSSQQHPWGAETLLFTDAVVRMLYPLSGANQDQLTVFQQKRLENSVYYGVELLLDFTLKDSPGMPIFLPILFDRGTTLGQYAVARRELLAAEDAGTAAIEVLNFVGPASVSRKHVENFVTVKERLARVFVKKDARRSIETKIMESTREPATPASAAAAAKPGVTVPDAVATATIVPSLNTDARAVQWYNPALHDVSCENLQRFLTQPRAYAEVGQIRNFLRFRELSATQQQDLAKTCPVYSAAPNSLLLERGSAGEWNLYLLQGDLQLTAADGEHKTIGGETENSRSAVATLKPRKFTVTALTRARFLWIHENIVAEIQRRQPGAKLELL